MAAKKVITAAQKRAQERASYARWTKRLAKQERRQKERRRREQKRRRDEKARAAALGCTVTALRKREAEARRNAKAKVRASDARIIQRELKRAASLKKGKSLTVQERTMLIRGLATLPAREVRELLKLVVKTRASKKRSDAVATKTPSSKKRSTRKSRRG
jgi:hypothetical protein